MIRKLLLMLVASMLLVSTISAASPSEDKLFRMTFEKIDDHNIELNNLDIVDETPPNDIESSGEYLLELQSEDNETLYSHNFSFGYEINGHFPSGGRMVGGELSELTVVTPYFENADYLQVSDNHGDILLREVIQHPTDEEGSDTGSQTTEVSETNEEGMLDSPVIWVILGVPVAVLLVLVYMYRKRT